MLTYKCITALQCHARKPACYSWLNRHWSKQTVGRRRGTCLLSSSRQKKTSFLCLYVQCQSTQTYIHDARNYKCIGPAILSKNTKTGVCAITIILVNGYRYPFVHAFCLLLQVPVIYQLMMAFKIMVLVSTIRNSIPNIKYNYSVAHKRANIWPFQPILITNYPKMRIECFQR